MRLGVIPVAMLAGLAAPAPAQAPLSQAEQTAAFRAAGFESVGGKWQACGDPGTESYSPGAIEQVGDLNGDGRPEVVITEGSSYCFGMTGTGFALVSKQADGSWKLINGGQGIMTPLASKGAGGWPDLEIGGPGSCFPVERWNGTAYELNRFEYEGKACKPPE